jgi:hypothetical protein
MPLTVQKVLLLVAGETSGRSRVDAQEGLDEVGCATDLNVPD